MKDTNVNDAGLTPTEQAPASAIATVEIDDKTVTGVWQEFVRYSEVRVSFVKALRRFASGRTVSELYDSLSELNVPRRLFGPADRVARGDRRMAWKFTVDLLPKLGTGQSSSDDILDTAQLFTGLETAPTVAVTLDKSDFETLRPEQREDVCTLLSVLSQSFDVRLVCSGVTRLWLRDKHRADLPGVSDWSSTHRSESHIDDALEALDPDGRESSILQLLNDEPTGTLTYHAIRSNYDVSRSRVSQCISTLSDYGLVETFGVDRKASLLEPGREFLDEITTQTTLEAAVSDTPKTHQHNRVTPEAREGPQGTGFYRTEWMDRPQHTATVACSTGNSGIVTVEDAISHHNATDRLVSFDETRREAVVSVAGGSVQQYTVSSATVLTTPKFLDSVLPTSELAQIVEDEPEVILRDARCIGWLSEETLNDAQALRDRLVEKGIQLEDLTRKLRHGEPENPEQLSSEIVRLAQGLAGTVVHLLDHVDVTLVREIRVPSGLSLDKLDELAESITTSAVIQSRYGAFAAYRQLFETRETKRQTALSPQVDATDPLGSLIGEIVLRGSDAMRLKEAVEGQLSGSKPHDGAPEFAINIPVESVNRSAYAVVTKRILDRKNIKSTREAVSILHGLVDSPYLAAKALNQLGSEDTPREIRADELRYALRHLDGEDILSELPQSVGEIVSTLLEATEPLTQTELANRADVSTQTIRNNRDALEALDVIRVEGAEFRLSLSFSTTAERRSGIVPSPVGKDTAFMDVLDTLLLSVLPADRYGDPSDRVGGVLFYPQEPWQLLEHEQLSGWVKLIARLTETEIPEQTENSTVSVGPAIKQQSIQPSTGAV
jgi:hypothetical protein